MRKILAVFAVLIIIPTFGHALYCNPGTYFDDGGGFNGQCLNCTPGQHCTGGNDYAAVQENCGQGNYCPTTGPDAYNRQICPAGYFCPGANETTPTNCGVGNYCPGAGSIAGTPCAGGYYCSDSNSADGAGTVNGPNSTNRHECESGYWCAGGNRNQCPTNYRSGPTRQSAQTGCRTSCDPGTRVTAANGTCVTDAGPWYTSVAHTVNYGQISPAPTPYGPVHSCMTDYNIPTTVQVDHSNSAGCVTTCAVGYAVLDANDICRQLTDANLAAAGLGAAVFVDTAHNVYQGQTSGTINTCPALGGSSRCLRFCNDVTGNIGYDESIAPRTQITDCYTECSGGYYVPAAYQECTPCGQGQSCTGGRVSWGGMSTSTNCLAGHYCASGQSMQRCPRNAHSEAGSSSATDCYIPGLACPTGRACSHAVINFSDSHGSFRFPYSLYYAQ